MTQQRAIFQHVAIPRSDGASNVNIIPLASITLYEYGTTTKIRQRIYAGPSGGSPITNPITADSNGYAACYVDRGQPFTVLVTAPDGSTQTYNTAAYADPSGTEHDFFNVKSAPYLAIGDGSSHPLSTYFGTLVAAQAVYPHATSLTNELDWAAIQGAINDAGVNGGTVIVPHGYYRINVTLLVKYVSGLRIVGHGAENATVTGTGIFGSVGSVLRNYTGGTCLRVRADASITNGLRNTLGIYLEDFGVENQSASTDTGILVDSDQLVSPFRVTLERLAICRGLNGIHIQDSFDTRILNCHIQGFGTDQSGATVQFGGDSGVYGVRLTNYIADMVHMRDTYIAGWTSNVFVDPPAFTSPGRLWFDNCTFETTKHTNIDVGNVLFTHFENCHFEQGGIASDPWSNDAHTIANPNYEIGSDYVELNFGSTTLAAGETGGWAVLTRCDFSGVRGLHAINAGGGDHRFHGLTMRSCIVSAAPNSGNFLKADNSSVTGYANRYYGQIDIEDSIIMGGIDTTNYVGAVRWVGNRRIDGTRYPDRTDEQIQSVPLNGAANVALPGIYFNNYSLSSTTAASIQTITRPAEPGLGRRRITLYFEDSNVTLKTGGAGTEGIIPRGGANYTYPAGSYITLFDTGAAWQELYQGEPAALSVACNNNLTLSNVFQDVANASITLSVGTWMVEGSFWFVEVQGAGTDLNNQFFGQVVAGTATATITNSGSYAIWTPQTAAQTATATKTWKVRVTAGGTMKLQAAKAAGTGSSLCGQPHTTITAWPAGNT